MNKLEANKSGSSDLSHGPGRPTKYNERTITTLCEALSRGSTIKAACAAAGIGVQTLADWRQDDSELDRRIEAAQEEMRQKALQTIKDAVVQGHWRAAIEALKLCFPEYRATSKLEVNAITSPPQYGYVISEERLAELKAKSDAYCLEAKPHSDEAQTNKQA